MITYSQSLVFTKAICYNYTFLHLSDKIYRLILMAFAHIINVVFTETTIFYDSMFIHPSTDCIANISLVLEKKGSSLASKIYSFSNDS